MLRCGSVRFSDVVNPTVRFGYILRPTVRFGAVFQHRKTYGAVRFGFEEGKNLTVRFGAVNRTEPHRTDRTNRTVKNPAYLHATGTCVFTVWAGIGERVSLQVAKKNRHQSFTTFNLSEWASNINSILHIFTGITQTTVYNTQEKGWF